jgi:hypothetical protein
MRSNVNILTAASEYTVVQQNTGYENSTAAHVAGDLGAHNQVLFYGIPFAEADTGHTINNGYLLRMQVTGINGDGTGDVAITVPALLTGTAVDSGGKPVIIRQPGNIQAVVGQTVTFTVKAISADPMTYQWYKDGALIAGATSSTYVIGTVKHTDQASYYVVVCNVWGCVTSNTATLTVVDASAGFAYHQDGCFLPDTLITMADGSLRQINKLVIGDSVLSYDVAGLDPNNENAWKTWSASKLLMAAGTATVKDIYIQSFNGYFQLADLKVTYEHPILSLRNGVWAFREVQSLKKTDFIWKNGSTVPMPAMTYVPGRVQTYNLNVEQTDVFVANGFLAHNNFFKTIWQYTPAAVIFGAPYLSIPPTWPLLP